MKDDFYHHPLVHFPFVIHLWVGFQCKLVMWCFFMSNMDRLSVSQFLSTLEGTGVSIGKGEYKV